MDGAREFDILAVLSLAIGYENLIENRAQTAHNDVSAANDKQAEYLIRELSAKFEEQNEMLKKILEVITDGGKTTVG